MQGLNMKGFKQHLHKVNDPDLFGGITYTFRFDNGYGASVSTNIKTRFRLLWTTHLIKFVDESDKYTLVTRHPFKEVMEMHLTDKDVRKILGEIKGL